MANNADVCSVEGACTITIPLSPRISIGTVKRGVVGTADGAPLCIRRPRYGWRRSNRSVFITGNDGIDLYTEYAASRRYRIRRRQDGSIVYERRGRRAFANRDVSPAEVAAAIAVEVSDVIQTSSLVNFITI